MADATFTPSPPHEPRDDTTEEHEGKVTLKSLTGSHVPIYTWSEFLCHCVPGYCQQETDPKFENLLLVPSPDLKPLKQVDLSCHQSLASLVDEAVWTLVKRRERSKLLGRKGVANAISMNHRNILCQGYSIRSDEQYVSNTSHFAMVMTHMNSSVDFCKTSTLLKNLHALYGDDIVRTLLLQTSIFVLLEGDGWNYLQVVGPPLPSSSRTPSDKQTRRYAPEELQPRTVLPRRQRKSLFYSGSYVPKVGLGKNHVLTVASSLEKKEGSTLLLREILRDIIGENDSAKHQGFERWKQVLCKGVSSGSFQSALSFCEQIVQNHRSTDYHRTLEHYCPMVNLDQDLASLSTQGYSSHSQVTSWVRSVVRSVFPMHGWGGSSARLFDHLIPKYVALRRDEHFANKTLLHGIRVTKFKWIAPLSSFSNTTKNNGKPSSKDHERCRLLVLSFLRWFFSEYITPLLRSVFVVTDSEFTAKQVLYYRKPVWARFRNLSLDKLICKEGQYEELPRVEVFNRVTELGMSRLRLLPKATGVRPIATLCRQEAGAVLDDVLLRDMTKADLKRKIPPTEAAPAKSLTQPLNQTRRIWKSTNSVLDDAFAVLKYEQSRKKGSLGVGLEGLHYFYPRYLAFVKVLRENPSAEIYFGSVDIRHCFDNIDQGHLLDVVGNLLTEEDYLLQKYKITHSLPSMGRVAKRQRKEVRPLEAFEPFYKTVSAVAGKTYRSIVTDGMSCVTVKKEKIMQFLRDHLTSHLVVTNGRHGSRFLVQKTGIPQGSVLSSLLCNIYYASIETELCGKDLTASDGSGSDDKNFLVRMVDDFMVISVVKGRVELFVERMEKGDAARGVKINKEKTRSSPNVFLPNSSIGGTGSSANSNNEDSGFFPWCGMLFHHRTGEVRIDYSRLLETESNVSLTVERASKEGESLSLQMKNFVRPRCLPVLFDSKINPTSTQLLNFYQMMVFAAVKTLVYIHSSDMLVNLESNTRFLLGCIDSTSVFGYNLITQKLNAELNSNKTTINQKDAIQLGWFSFLDVCFHVRGFNHLQESLYSKVNMNSRPTDQRFVELRSTLSLVLSNFFKSSSMA